MHASDTCFGQQIPIHSHASNGSTEAMVGNVIEAFHSTSTNQERWSRITQSWIQNDIVELNILYEHDFMKLLDLSC